MGKLLRAVIVLLAALTCHAWADDTVEVTPWTVAEFGGEAGDSLSLERITANGAVVLLNPHDEDCTLRFSMSLGEKVKVRGATF